MGCEYCIPIDQPGLTQEEVNHIRFLKATGRCLCSRAACYVQAADSISASEHCFRAAATAAPSPTAR